MHNVSDLGRFFFRAVCCERVGYGEMFESVENKAHVSEIVEQLTLSSLVLL